MNPIVSVAIHTYNHKNFITQTIESVLMQQTDFAIEIIVGDDASTDGTSEILNDFATQYPDKVRVYIHPNNLGPKGFEGKNNFLFVLEKCNGKYIALLDGDDYWIDPLKLQKQVDFLEKNSDTDLCFTDVYDLTPEHGQQLNINDSSLPTIFDMSTAFLYRMPPLTWVFRKSLLPNKFPDFFLEVFNGDWAFLFICFHHSKIAYMNVVTGVYRMHHNSQTRTKNKIIQLKNGIRTNEKLNSYLKYRLSNILGNYYFHLSTITFAYLEEKKYWKAFQYFLKTITHKPFINYRYYLSFIKSVFSLTFKAA
jgi:glycosyltransferase involved in cell wall biosynthesis